MSDFVNNLNKIGMVMQAGGGSLAGRDGMAVVREYQQQQEDERKRAAIAGLLAQSGIGGVQRGLLEQLPVEQQAPAILNFMQQMEAQRRAGGAASAAAARQAQEQQAYTEFMSNLQGQKQPQQSAYSTGVSGDFVAPSQPLSLGMPSAAPEAARGGLSFGSSAVPAPSAPSAPADAYTGARATYERLLRMPPPPPGTPLRKAYDDALAHYERQVEFFEPPAPAQDPAAELKIRRLMETGLDRETAIGLADGRIVVTPLGELMDRATGTIIEPPTAPEPMPAPEAVPETRSALPADGVDYRGAFGVEGSATGLINNVADFALGFRPFQEQGRARTALTNLRTRTLTTLASASVAGRPSNYVMEMFNQNVVQPRIGSGPEGALDTAEQTLSFIDSMIAENKAILDSRSRVDQATRSSARRSIEMMEGLRQDYEIVVNGLRGQGSSETAASVPPAVMENPQLKASAERHGVTIEELWENLSPEARRRFGGQ